MTTTKPNVIFVLGAPGAGKGTQCDRITKDYEYVHLSVGDLLREEADKSDSDLGNEIKNTMENGSLVSAEMICKLIGNAIRKNGKENYLIDGFPRDLDNITEWKKSMSDRVNLQCVLLFDCDEKTSINRCMERGKDSGRIDDNEETLKKRIATYQGSTKAAIQYYKKENLVKQIDASNDVEKVYEDVQNVMKNFK
ncbi:unnamed protein product [Adineta steineri]|uniref:Uncharacterized protein n=1 Tax=Adineta steineri TaxID=433720 RepID=A0A819KMP0_9BILA|nr:unnamed protein product [Adineta steineri]CAF3948703.1 unnamed protein product [Adineta steineri]